MEEYMPGDSGVNTEKIVIIVDCYIKKC
jgi:hypothetical protein